MREREEGEDDSQIWVRGREEDDEDVHRGIFFKFIFGYIYRA